jgi:hypothetical protein
LLELISPMLREQALVMHAEFEALDHGAVARPTVPHQGSTAGKRVHAEMVTRTYVRARETQRARRGVRLSRSTEVAGWEV